MLEKVQSNQSSEWSSLSWSEQTYYLAKYGYTETGVPTTDSIEICLGNSLFQALTIDCKEFWKTVEKTLPVTIVAIP